MPVLTLTPEQVTLHRQALADYQQRCALDADALDRDKRAPNVANMLRRMASHCADVHAKLVRL